MPSNVLVIGSFWSRRRVVQGLPPPPAPAYAHCVPGATASFLSLKPHVREHPGDCLLGRLHRVHYGLGSRDHVARCEHAGHAGLAMLVDAQKPAVVAGEALGGGDELAERLLRGGDDHRVAGHLVELFLVADHLVLGVEQRRPEDGARLIDGAHRLAVHNVRPVELGILHLV